MTPPGTVQQITYDSKDYAGEYFTFGDGRIKNVLDHMIEKGEIPPMIVVSATFYHEGSPQDFGSFVRLFVMRYRKDPGSYP